MAYKHSVKREATVNSAVGQMVGKGSLYMTVWALQLLCGTLITPVLTRDLGPTDFGRAALSISIMQVLLAIFSLGLQSGVQRVYAEPGGPARSQGLLSVACVLALVLTGVAAVTEPAWAAFAGFSGMHNLALLTVYWSGAGAITQVGLAFLRSQDRFAPFAVVGIAQAAGGQLVGLLLLTIVSRSATLYVTGLFVGQLAAMAVALVSVRPLPGGLRDWSTMRGALLYSVPLVPNLLSAFILNAGDRVVVQHDLGSYAVGRYQLAYVIGSMGIVLLGTINQTWAPRFLAIVNDRERWAVLAHLRDEVFTLLLPIILGLAVGGPLALRLLAPPRYHPNGLLVVEILVVTSAVPYAVYLANIRVLLWFKRTGVLACASGFAAVLNVALNLWLVPHLHILGSALATFVCYVALAVTTTLTARRYVRLALPRWQIVAVGLTAVGGAYATLVLPVSTGFLLVRAACAGLCVVWLFVSGWRIAKRE